MESPPAGPDQGVLARALLILGAQREFDDFALAADLRQAAIVTAHVDLAGRAETTSDPGQRGALREAILALQSRQEDLGRAVEALEEMAAIADDLLERLPSAPAARGERLYRCALLRAKHRIAARRIAGSLDRLGPHERSGLAARRGVA